MTQIRSIDLYARTSVPLLPTLAPRTVVPGSVSAVQGGMRFTPLGAVNAVAELLTSQYELRQGATLEDGALGAALFARRRGRPGWSRLDVGDELVFHLHDPEHAAVLLIAAAHRDLSVSPTVASAWTQLGVTLGGPGPSLAIPSFTPTQMRAEARSVTPPVVGVADAAAYTLDQAAHQVLPGLPERDAPTAQNSVDVLGALMSGEAFPRAGRAGAAGAGLQGELPRRLARWLGQGLNVLLTGPTATFKTTHLNCAAERLRMSVVTVAGRPGLEDRDFYGGVYPLAGGPGWVDGPVTTAFRLAGTGARTLLVFNEITRFEPLYFNAVIGLLDELSGAQLRSNGIEFSREQLAALELTSQDDGRYYLLELPNGERLPCPTHLLSVAGTANLGADYVTTGELDAALLRRFHRHLEVTHPEEGMVLPLHIKAAAGDEHLARVAYQLEVFTRSEVIDAEEEGAPGAPGAGAEGLLKRCMNFSTTQALVQETADLKGSGVAGPAAFVLAAESTVIPYCVPRTRSGLLDPPAARRLRDDVRRHSAMLDD